MSDAGVAERVQLTGTTATTLSQSLGRTLVWLTVVAAVSAGVHAFVATSLPVPWIIPDELIYSELAKSIGDGHLPSVRDVPTGGYGVLYPLLVSPAWALFDDPATAYGAAKIINAVVLSLTAFPAFFLARRYVLWPTALLVSALSVFVPSMLYAGTLLTEVALYPTFVLAVLAVSAALRNPTRQNQLLALASIGLACLAKPLALVLVLAYALSVLHLAALDRLRGTAAAMRLRAYGTSLAVVGGLGLVFIGGSTARGNPDAILGVYGVVLGHIDLSGAVVWFVRHLAALDLYVALVPFGATLVLVVLSTKRQGDRILDEYAVLVTWTVTAVVAALAAYSSKPLAGAEGYLPSEARLHERNMFMVTPLLIIGLGIWLERGQPGGRRLRVACAAIAAGLPLLLPLSRLLLNANFQNLALIPFAGEGMTELWPLTFLPLAAVAAAALLGRGRRSALACWVIVALAFAWTSLAAHVSMSTASTNATGTGIGSDTRWIDRAVPRGSEVVALWISDGAIRWGRQVIFMNELFNRSLRDVVEVGAPMPYALPTRTASVVDGVLRDELGEPISATYVLVPCWAQVQGARVAWDEHAEASVYRLPAGPIRLAPSPAKPACG